MIPLFGSALGASWPLFLAAIPLATALLVYIFRTRGMARPVITSTLFILSKLPHYQPHRRRFVPPLQFWLELAACLLLALAAGGLFVSDLGKRVAIVLDTSKSMSALQSDNQTRLETARRIAEADIAQSEPYTKFAVFTADTTLTQRGSSGVDTPRLVSAREARVLVDEAQQSFAADTLASLVAPLVSSGEYDHVWIYTDKEFEGDTVDPRVRVITVPSDLSTLNNVWIESLSVAGDKKVDPNGGGNQLVARLSAVRKGSDLTEIPVEVATRCFNVRDSSSFSLPRVKMSVRSGETVVVKLGEVTGAWSYCSAQLSTTLKAASDAIILDNEAWIANSADKNEVTLVSSLTSNELGLTQLPFEFVRPDNSATFDGTRQAIYHRTVPSSTPRQAPSAQSLIILPPSGAALWDNGSVSRATLRNVEITRWDESHPLLRYVKPPLLSIPQGVAISCPRSAQAIMHSSAGPLVCAGEDRGARYVITGFELLPFDGLRTPTVSIFTLNVLRWLFESHGVAGAGSGDNGAQVGFVKLPPGADAATVIAPHESELKPSAAGNSVFVPAPGVLALRPHGSETSSAELIAVNAFSREESDVATQRMISVPIAHRERIHSEAADIDRSSSRGLNIRDKTQLESLLATALLIVLCLDLARRIVTRARWGGGV